MSHVGTTDVRGLRRTARTLLHRRPDLYWPWIVAPAVLLLQYWLYAPFPARHHLNPDPATFQYGGNLLARGYPPFRYLWDVKPPLIYDTTGLIALLAPGDPMTQFYLGSFLTSAATLGTILLAGAIVHRETGADLPALVTSVTILAYTHVLLLPARGVWPKYFALWFGFLGLYLALGDRPILGVAAATLAPGYWQFGVVFPLIAALLAWRRDASLPLAAGASAGVTAIAVAPIVLLGALDPMIHQAVVTPLTMGDQSTGLLFRVRKFHRIVPWAWPVFYAAAVASASYVYDRREAWWLGVGVGWGLLQIGLLDFDASPDPLLLVVFLAVGLGLFAGRLDRRQQLVVALVVLSVGAAQFGGYRWRFEGGPATENPDTAIHEALLSETYPPATCLIARGGVPPERRASGAGLPRTCDSPPYVG